ncbi:MAG: sulfatase [Candidatus Omnitrophota bacterium]
MKFLKGKQAIIVFLFFIVLSCAVVNYLSARPKRINVILITLDALRADHLGCYGYSRNTSPNIDKLAEEGVMFSSAISQATWTGGSLSSLLTAMYPSTHRVEDWGVVLDKRLTTIAELLKNKQYVTACSSGGDRIYKNVPGMEKGFDHFFDAIDAKELFKQAVGWIQKNKNNNFFVWMHLFDYPHAPYHPLPPFDQKFISKQPAHNLPIGKDKESKSLIGVIPPWVAVSNIADVNYYISQYDGEIAFADSLIGELLAELKNEKLNRNTIVIISSDHGESLGERGVYFQHGDCLYNQEIRVPLIISGAIVPRGKVIQYPVQLVDVLPSVAKMLGIKLNIKVEGKSFYPFTANKKNNFAFSEVGITKTVEGVKMNFQDKAVISGGWKLIYESSGRGDRYELYNLKFDPQELHNLAELPEAKEKLKFLKEKLEIWMYRLKPSIKSLAKPLDEITQKKLKSLGYLQ